MRLNYVITIIEGRNLISADKNGFSDPYVKYAFMNVAGKTKKIKKNLNPVWNFEFDLVTNDQDVWNNPLSLDVKDWDRFGKDDPLGKCDVYLGEMSEAGEYDRWVTLEGVDHGEVHLKIVVTQDEMEIVGVLENELAFFRNVRSGMGDVNIERDYILIIDKSGSMSGSRWTAAKDAVKHLSKFVCKADPDGVTLLFFSSSVVEYKNIKSADQVNKCFSKQSPTGGTNLTSALQKAFDEHFGSEGYTTILVITDGAPNSPDSVKRCITEAANNIQVDEELSISFIQIGNDKSAENFLKSLDDDLDCQFDIVDTLSMSDMKELSFSDLIRSSIGD